MNNGCNATSFNFNNEFILENINGITFEFARKYASLIAGYDNIVLPNSSVNDFI